LKNNPAEESRRGKSSPKNKIVLLLGVIFLVLFLLTWLLVAYSKGVVSLDSSLELFINSHQYGALTTIMVFASLYGREYFWIPVVAIMLIFGKQNTKMLAIELAILFVVGIVFGEALKMVFFRERPYVALGSEITVPAGIPPDTDSSFPSGHAIVVAIGACLIFWKFFFGPLSIRSKVVSLLLVLEAAIVCYSRLYNGVHYPLDVAAGVFLAVAIVLLGGYLLEVYFGSWLRKFANVAEYITKKLLHIPEMI
jgi:membrane-associated phospholipid phosphatase